MDDHVLEVLLQLGAVAGFFTQILGTKTDVKASFALFCIALPLQMALLLPLQDADANFLMFVCVMLGYWIAGLLGWLARQKAYGLP